MSGMTDYKFAEFILSPAKRKLFRNGREVELHDRNFDVLLVLIANRPQTLSKDEIIKSVWNGLAVENNSVERAVVNIRKVLGDRALNPRFIKTIRGKGYLFVCDVDEIRQEIQAQPITEQYKTIEPKESVKSRNLSKWISPFLIMLVFIGLFLLVEWKGYGFYRHLTSQTVFYDDFSDKEIDTRKWIAEGKNVRLSEGIAKISVDEVDKGGNLQSVYFTIDPNKAFTIKSRIKVTYNQSVDYNINFVGAFGFAIPNDASNNDAVNFYGVKYANAEGEFCYAGNIVKTEGFYLVKDDGDVRVNRHHTDGKIGPRIEPVWQKWFRQKLVYEPQNETMLYFIDGEKKGEFVIGKLPLGDKNKLRLEIYPRGWWLHHSLEIDDIEVAQ